MLVALADTHATDAPALTDHLRRRLRAAETVVHAGDLTTEAALEGLRDAAGALQAVHGNSDSAALRAALPATRTVEALGERVLVVHGHEHDRTSLPLLARQEGAGVAVVGHTHRPAVTDLGDLLVVNPGSHADPRGARPACATLDLAPDGGDPRARLWTPTGERIGVRDS